MLPTTSIASDNTSLSPRQKKLAFTLINYASALKNSSQPLIIIFGLGSYGDVLQITALLRHLRKQFSDAHLVLVHPNSGATSLLSYENTVDQIFIVDSSAFFWIRSQLVNFGSADLIINCRYVIEYILPEASRLSKEQLSFVVSAQSYQKFWLPFTESFPFDNDLLWRASIENNMNMYALMAYTSGFGNANFENLKITLQPSDFVLRNELPERYLVVSNSAEPLTTSRSNWTKTIPAEKMSRIVNKIKRHGIKTVQLGANTNELHIDGVDFDYRGRTNLRQAAAILRDSKLHVAPEGGLANLGRAVGNRGVIFFCSTPLPFFAFSDNLNIVSQLCGNCWWTTESYLFQCPRLLRTPVCGKSISEDEIIRSVKFLLDQH